MEQGVVANFQAAPSSLRASDHHPLPSPSPFVGWVCQYLPALTEACKQVVMESFQRMETLWIGLWKMEVKQTVEDTLQSWVKRTSMKALVMMQYCSKKTWKAQTGCTVWMINSIKDPSLIMDLSICLNLSGSYNTRVSVCNFFLFLSSFKLYGFLIWMNHLKHKNEEPVLACEISAFILVDVFYICKYLHKLVAQSFEVQENSQFRLWVCLEAQNWQFRTGPTHLIRL